MWILFFVFEVFHVCTRVCGGGDADVAATATVAWLKEGVSIELKAYVKK